MQAIIELSITEHSLTVTKVLNPAFNEDCMVKEQCLLIYADSLHKTFLTHRPKGLATMVHRFNQ